MRHASVARAASARKPPTKQHGISSNAITKNPSPGTRRQSKEPKQWRVEATHASKALWHRTESMPMMTTRRPTPRSLSTAARSWEQNLRSSRRNSGRVAAKSQKGPKGNGSSLDRHSGLKKANSTEFTQSAIEAAGTKEQHSGVQSSPKAVAISSSRSRENNEVLASTRRVENERKAHDALVRRSAPYVPPSSLIRPKSSKKKIAGSLRSAAAHRALQAQSFRSSKPSQDSEPDVVG